MDQALKRRARDKEARPKKVTRSKKALEKALEKLPAPKRPALQRAIEKYAQSRDREVAELRQEVQLYRTLSTAGITAATFAHESAGSPIKVITANIKTIERRAKKELSDRYDTTLKEPVEDIANASESLSVLGSATLRLVDHEKRRLGRVDLHEVIGEVLATFKPFLMVRQIEVHPELVNRKPFIRGSEAAIESVLTNLLNNSIAAFESFTAGTREIWVSTDVEQENFIMKVSDNGPGISVKRVNDVFLPGFSTKPNGTGLGLAIVRDSIVDLGGTVDVEAKGPHGGAEFIVTLPLLGA
jgi:C4-dicarboxylate-specific signal transduction histidine kinase